MMIVRDNVVDIILLHNTSVVASPYSDMGMCVCVVIEFVKIKFVMRIRDIVIVIVMLHNELSPLVEYP